MKVTPRQLRTYLGYAIPAGHTTLIKGAPGIGKSDIVKSAASDLEYDIMIMHPVVSEPTDFKGLPARTPDGADFIPYGDLDRMINTDAPTVVFLDDLGQAPPAVQAACMQLLLERSINGKRISETVTFVAATNRKSDRAGVTGILEPVKSRFATILELVPSVKDWVSWAVKQPDIPPEVIAFINFRPAFITAFVPTADIENSPCPRTIHNAARQLSLALPDELLFPAVSGAAGAGFATELLAFVRLYRDLPDIDTIISSPGTAPVPDKPDVRYAVCGMLASESTIHNFPDIMEYALRLPKEFQAVIIRDALDRKPALAETSAYTTWITDNADMLLS